jgi:predicted ATPase
MSLQMQHLTESDRISAEKPTIPNNLQLQLTPVLGREAELMQLDQLLGNPSRRCITLHGPGGIGKTRLALATAERQLTRQTFVDGVYFVGLTRLNSADEIFTAIADNLDYNFVRLSQLLDYMRNKNMLLILDNFEHVMAGVTLVEEILRASRHSQVIITSREKLNRQWEHLFHLSGLAYPTSNGRKTETELAHFGAMQLFLNCARRVQPVFDTLASLEHVERICQLVEGMPLGIILAATWLDVLRPEEVAQEIQRGLDFLASEMGDIPRRQRSLRATFAYSWRLLSEAERDIFKQLSVFQGGFTREAAQEVTGATLHDLRSLVGKSLIYTDHDGRYQIHELLRQFSAEHLAADTAAQNAAKDRHAAYFSQKVEEWYARVKSPEHKQIMALFDIEINNALIAWRHAVEQKNSAWVGQMIEPLSLYDQWRGRQSPFLDDLKRAEAVFAPRAETVHDKLTVVKLRTHIAARLSDPEMKKQMLQGNIDWLKDDIFADIDTRVIESDCWFYFGGLSGPFDTVEENLATREQSIRLSEQAGDEWRLAVTLALASTDMCWLAEFEEAAELARRSRPIAEKLGDPFLSKAQMAYEANVLNFITPVEEMTIVEEICHRYIAIQYDLGAVYSGPPHQLVFTLCTQGRYEEARTEIAKGLVTLAERNQPDLTTRGLYSISSVHFDDGALARSLLDGFSPPAGIVAGWFSVTRGRLSLANGNRNEACRLFEQALTNFREDNSPSDAIWFSADLALAARTREALHKAIDGVLSSKAYALIQWLLPAAALTFLEEGDVERAVELYALAETYAAIAKSRWYATVAGKEIAGSAEKLPAHIVTAAQKRGRTLDTMTTLNQLRSELATTL